MYKKFMLKDCWARNMFRRSILDYCLADVILMEAMSMYGKFKIEDSMARNVFSK
jgi:hypothetical protein